MTYFNTYDKDPVTTVASYESNFEFEKQESPEKHSHYEAQQTRKFEITHRGRLATFTWFSLHTNICDEGAKLKTKHKIAKMRKKMRKQYGCAYY